MVSSLVIKRLLSSTIEGTANLCVYDANHNGDELTVTISCPVAVGCCERGCCKLSSNFLTSSNGSSTFNEDPISSEAYHLNETVLLTILTVMIFFMGCISLMFIVRKVQKLRHKDEDDEPDFVYHAYHQPQPKIITDDIYGSPC